MKFTWDEIKNIANQQKHGISFEEVVPMLSGTEYEIEFDQEHSTHDEDRFRAYGNLQDHGEVIVVFIEIVDDVIRIISARKA